MKTLVIAEKASQARDIRAAVGDRHGPVLPAEGHLLRLAEPEEVDPAWRRWSFALLKPEGLYPTRPDRDGGKPAKLEAIRQALKGAARVIIATDCDREGQLIGQEILEHLRFRGEVMRAIFTAQDPATLREAFANLRPNAEYRHLYAAAAARRQADQVFNLSLTRAATRALVPAGTRGVIGIGRVKTPTLAIVCRRELEIRDFRPEDYFEVVATAAVAGGTFRLRHAPPPARRIEERTRAEAIAALAEGFRGPLSVAVEARREPPPRLPDLPALQKACGWRWGWTAERTLSVAQELYDGEGKKLITYPRAEARYLAERQAEDVPAVLAALLRLRGFAALEVGAPVIRRGRSGHFHDKGLAGVAHHAVVPNVKVVADLEARIARLGEDEKRLFALVCRSYLAAVMPDHEYRRTTVRMDVGGHEFRTVGRITLKAGWRAAYGAGEPEGGGRAGEDKRTQPPPRYGEGALMDAMQNAWRFVEDPAQRERLKEARGIGTPATRAAIIEGLKRQGLLAPSGRWIVPTEAGLELHALLSGAAPALVDPGTTAVWELRLDGILRRAGEVRPLVDAIAEEAARLIEVLKGQSGRTIAPAAGAPRPPAAKGPGRRRGARGVAAPRAGKGRARRADPGQVPGGTTPTGPAGGAATRPPTDRMLGFARSLARARRLDLPEGAETDYDTCRRFLDAHAQPRPSGGAGRRSRAPARRSSPDVRPGPGGGAD